jgi:hypothetical protein
MQCLKNLNIDGRKTLMTILKGMRLSELAQAIEILTFIERDAALEYQP